MSEDDIKAFVAKGLGILKSYAYQTMANTMRKSCMKQWVERIGYSLSQVGLS